MDVESTELFEVTVVGSVGGDELGNDGERPGGVHLVGGAGSVEGAVVQPVRCKVATVLVAHSVVPVARVVVAADDAFALRLIVGGARVSGESLGLFVGLPNVQLGAAIAVVAFARVGVVRDRYPVLAVGFSGDPLDVVRALGVAVACTVLGSAFVGRVFRCATIGIHGHLCLYSLFLLEVTETTYCAITYKVEGAVQAAVECRDIDVVGEFPVQQLEHAVPA